VLGLTFGATNYYPFWLFELFGKDTFSLQNLIRKILQRQKEIKIAEELMGIFTKA
jgi:hypothetical protein